MSLPILLPFDGSASSQRALALLAGYQGAKDALNVFVLNAQPQLAATYPEAAVAAGMLLETGEAIAATGAKQLAAAGLRAEAACRAGLPATTIAEEAKSRKAALIVMGTRGHGALRGFALGSVALRVVHAADVPVLLAHPEAKLPATLGRKLRVMLAIDGSEPSLRAARTLVDWRGWLGELDVQMVNVQEPLTLAERVLPPHDDLVEQWSTRAAEEAAREPKKLFDAAKIRSHLHLSAGDPAAEIVHLAGRTRCDMIAIGTRGKGAAHHAFVGSVALKVAAASPVPVLVVR